MKNDGEDFSCQKCKKQSEELHGTNDFKLDLIWLCEDCYEDLHGE